MAPDPDPSVHEELIELLGSVKQLLAWQSGLVNHALDRLLDLEGPMAGKADSST